MYVRTESVVDERRGRYVYKEGKQGLSFFFTWIGKAPYYACGMKKKVIMKDLTRVLMVITRI